METHLAYCATLDRAVRVFLRPVSYDDSERVNGEVPGIICLERGEACLGVRCPVLEQGVRSIERSFRR